MLPSRAYSLMAHPLHTPFFGAVGTVAVHAPAPAHAATAGVKRPASEALEPQPPRYVACVAEDADEDRDGDDHEEQEDGDYEDDGDDDDEYRDDEEEWTPKKKVSRTSASSGRVNATPQGKANKKNSSSTSKKRGGGPVRDYAAEARMSAALIVPEQLPTAYVDLLTEHLKVTERLAAFEAAEAAKRAAEEANIGPMSDRIRAAIIKAIKAPMKYRGKGSTRLTASVEGVTERIFDMIFTPAYVKTNGKKTKVAEVPPDDFYEVLYQSAPYIPCRYGAVVACMGVFKFTLQKETNQVRIVGAYGLEK